MDYVYYIYNNAKYFYNSMNPATLSGAIDVIVVEQPDGSLLSTPFHVRFGKYCVFNYEEKYVDIEINGVEIGLQMKLGENGVAFFLEKEENDEALTEEKSDNECKAMDDQRRDSMASTSSTEVPKSRSRTPSPNKKSQPTPLSQTSMKRAKISPTATPRQTAAFHQNMDSTVQQQQQRQRLPFSSSIYSCRRNRSLPDLANLIVANSKGTNVSENDGGDNNSDGRCKQPLSRQDTVSKLKMESEKRLKHSRSASMALKNYNNLANKEQENCLVNQKLSTGTSSSHQQKVSEEIEEDDEDNGIEMKTNIPSTSDDIASGALSDSEVDNERRNPRPNDPEWKWGEIPKGKTADKSGANGSTKKSRWNYWFGRWSLRHKQGEEGASRPEEGVFLQDISNDPAKLGIYIGSGRTEPISISSKSSDSGNGPSLGTSPSGTSFLSEENLATVGLPDGSGDRCLSGSLELSLVIEGNIKYKRSLRLSSDQLRLLKLFYGSNDARFSITTRYQGTAWCSCHIYLLKWSDKLVISDIDGTITKSDVLGHVIPAIGGTWAHSGVAELYTRIKRNGYQMVYLSSRAIGQSHYTKAYLQNFAQGSRTLPDGPVLLSPSSVLMAFRKEVIERKPEEFKIACLTDLKSLFPVEQPYFAGFGNRDTDSKSYRAVGIPSERILIIDPQGRLRRADNKVGYVSDYATMATDSVDYVFPPRTVADVSTEGTLSEFLAWRDDPQQFDSLVDAELEAYEEKSRRTANNGGDAKSDFKGGKGERGKSVKAGKSSSGTKHDR